MEQVQILMSTYNGEQYLETQLNSILNQTYSNLSVLIRDDGSTDHTVEILKKYTENYSNISFYQGKNIGVIGSFFDLLYNSDDSAAYYAMADQDDEWLPKKIECAVTMLQAKKEDKPLLYCSDTLITDENLNIIKKDDKNPRTSFGNALVQNICTGCTSVMNKSLRDIVKKTAPKNIVMHDWWLYLTATIYGEVCYDNNAYIRYRQHGDNTFGMKKNRPEVWKYRIGQLTAKRGYLYPQLREVAAWYPDMAADKRQMLQQVLLAEKGFQNRIRLILNKNIYRNDKRDDFVYRGIVMIGKL